MVHHVHKYIIIWTTIVYSYQYIMCSEKCVCVCACVCECGCVYIRTHCILSIQCTNMVQPIYCVPLNDLLTANSCHSFLVPLKHIEEVFRSHVLRVAEEGTALPAYEPVTATHYMAIQSGSGENSGIMVRKNRTCYVQTIQQESLAVYHRVVANLLKLKC